MGAIICHNKGTIFNGAVGQAGNPGNVRANHVAKAVLHSPGFFIFIYLFFTVASTFPFFPRAINHRETHLINNSLSAHLVGKPGFTHVHARALTKCLLSRVWQCACVLEWKANGTCPLWRGSERMNRSNNWPNKEGRKTKYWYVHTHTPIFYHSMYTTTAVIISSSKWYDFVDPRFEQPDRVI